MSVIALASVALAAIAVVGWAMREILRRTDRAETAEVRAARAEGAASGWQVTADTSERLRRAETVRADSLEEELAHADQTHASTPDATSRVRVLAHWRDAAKLTAAHPATADDSDGAGPLPVPGPAVTKP